MGERLRWEAEMLRDLGWTHLKPRTVSPEEDTSSGEDVERLAAVEAVAAGCVRCRLSETRTTVVFGSGNPRARLMFIGEAPGHEEDLQGLPFVGRAGQLLSDIIRAMKLTREAVYIANVIKCRPPGNRNPLPDEIASCHPYILQQIEHVSPEVIVTLGKFGFQALTGSDQPISRARGHWQSFLDVDLMPTYHPAYLLRNPSAKKDVWTDMRAVMKRLGIQG